MIYLGYLSQISHSQLIQLVDKYKLDLQLFGYLWRLLLNLSENKYSFSHFHLAGRSEISINASSFILVSGVTCCKYVKLYLNLWQKVLSQ